MKKTYYVKVKLTINHDADFSILDLDRAIKTALAEVKMATVKRLRPVQTAVGVSTSGLNLIEIKDPIKLNASALQNIDIKKFISAIL